MRAGTGARRVRGIEAGSDADSYPSNFTYNYPTGTNNGKISSMYNATTGETVSYTYDSLNRLLTAAGSGWGEGYGFDPFGNLLSKTVTSGSGPSLSQTVSTSTNQIQGVYGLTYDANGNPSATFNGGLTYNLSYDAENRMTMASGNGTYVDYGYDAQNRRLSNWAGAVDGNGNTTNYTVNVYSASGQKLGAYLIAPAFIDNAQTQWKVVPILQVTLSSSDQYFGSRRLAPMDQLGSAVNNSQSYFPWGETKGTSNPQDTWNYATYWQDSFTGLDYANNRYYSNAYGRFMTPDPYQGTSGGPGDVNNPQSWNRFAYVTGDPVNWYDPEGLDGCPPGWICQSFNPNPQPSSPLPPSQTGWQWVPPQSGLPFFPPATGTVINTLCGPMTFYAGMTPSNINPNCLTGCPVGQVLTANGQCTNYQQELKCQEAITGETILQGIAAALFSLAAKPSPLSGDFTNAAVAAGAAAYADSLYIKSNCSNFSPPMFTLMQ